MTPELMLKWETLLKYGNYKQGRKTLCKDGKHCCLNILRIAADIESPDTLNVINYIDDMKYLHKGDLSEKELEIVGMTSRQMATFTSMNDIHMMSFIEIAGKIREVMSNSY